MHIRFPSRLAAMSCLGVLTTAMAVAATGQSPLPLSPPASDLQWFDLTAKQTVTVALGRSRDALAPGRYRLTVPLGVVPCDGALAAELSVRLTVNASGRDLNLADLGAGGDLRVATLEFTVEQARSVSFTVGWQIGKTAWDAMVKAADQNALADFQKSGGDSSDDILTKMTGDGADDADAGLDLGGLDEADVKLPDRRLIVGPPEIREISPVVIEILRADRVTYAPGGTATLTIRLKNVSDRDAATGILRVSHVTGVDAVARIAEQPLELAPQSARDVVIPLAVGTVLFGHEVRAEVLVDGEAVARNSTVFSVADNLWDVALGTQLGGILHNTGMYGDRSPAIIAGKIADMRRNFSNWLEMDFWAPDDWGDLTPEPEEWISGQAARWENATWLKRIIDEAHKHGIKAITYGKGIAGGPAAYELLRQKPDYFTRQTSGVWGGNPDLWDLENWNNPKLNHYEGFKSVWHKVHPNLANLDPLDHGIQELIDSTRRFGWDGVRFDGQFTAVDDLVSTRNMRRTKERIWAEFPDFLFGFNMCSIFDRPAMLPHEEREAMAGGAHWMQEAIGDFGYLASVSYKTWRHYAENEWIAARRVQEAGGTYHYIYRLRGSAPAQYYKFVIGSLNGAHPCYGSHEVAPGARNWGRFLTRWGALLWHPGLKTIDPVEHKIGLEGAGEQILWKHWARTIPFSPDEELLVLPVVCLPAAATIESTTAYPAQVLGVRVTLPGQLRQRVKSIHWLDPNREPQSLAADEKEGISLPPIGRMGILVVSLKGCPDYRPVERPRFTEPVDPQALAKSLASGKKKVVVDPLRPELNHVDETPFPKIVRTHAADVTWSMARTVMDDPKAETGRAAGADNTFPSCVTGGYFFELLPGKYRITARVRREPVSPTGGFRVSIYENMPDGRGYKLREDSMRQGAITFDNADGTYKEVLLTADYEHHGLGFCAAFVHAGVKPDPATDPKFLLDWVQAERLETYDDHKLAEKAGLVTPADLRIGPASRVLWVRGLFDPLYQLGPALKQAFPDGRIDPVYQRDLAVTPEALAPYGTVVLPNVPAGSLAMTGRKALRDWTEAGGHLVILGGQLGFGQGGMKDSFLADVLPCRILRIADVVKLPQPKPLAAKRGAPGADQLLYYVHQVEAKPGATVTAWCGELPMIMSAAAGKGRCTIFAGTVLGAPRDDEHAFWNASDWTKRLAALLRGTN